MAIINNTRKGWLTVALASALILGACADKEPVTTADETAMDAQVAVEQGENRVGSADPLSSDGVAVAGADDDVAVATADDADILDGSESEEHISTY